MDSSEEPPVQDPNDELEKPETFKKPALIIGPIKGKVKKLKPLIDLSEQSEKNANLDSNPEKPEQEPKPEAEEKSKEKSEEKCDSSPCPYKEPSWSSTSQKEYKAEVLKSGVILETYDLTKKSCFVIGRLPSCDISLAHPSISRFHAVFQYGCLDGKSEEEGLYLYDLGSTHGTFWNGCKVKSKMYIKLHGGHIVTFGGSKRKFIISTPPEDEEPESEFTVTELKEMRRQELAERERQEKLEKLRKEEEEKAREEEGIDWGMGEDAEDEPELEDNPFAQTENHELYLSDPKKTLRGWFEREGYNLHYEVEERGPGQFLCYVNLPITDSKGRDIRAEALVKGKKKESVVQCAMEACKILDMHGYLRQSHHESRKKKRANAEDDYYNSDDDDFLDRTGSVEKKRNKKLAKDADSLSLAEKYTTVLGQIKQLEKALAKSKKKNSKNENADEEDELDSFMSELNKNENSKFEADLKKLNAEKSQLEKLMNKV